MGFKSTESALTMDDETNPHIPQFLSHVPWYLNSNGPSLSHQKNWKPKANHSKSSCENNTAETYQSSKFRKGACKNCGAMTHNAKSCTQRPRKLGAKWTNKRISPDERMDSSERDNYETKRDMWQKYDPSDYAYVVRRHEARDEARTNYLEGEQCKSLRVDDEAKTNECAQCGFASVKKRVRSSDGGTTGTVRNLRIREDTAKYLYNLDVDSAFYDPKSRSMREDPRPEDDPSDKFYGGDNQRRNNGQAFDFKLQTVHALNAFEKGQDIQMQSAPSQAEFLYKNYKDVVDKMRSQQKESVLKKYGNTTATEHIAKELLLGQTELEVQYDQAGRIIKIN